MYNRGYKILNTASKKEMRSYTFELREKTSSNDFGDIWVLSAKDNWERSHLGRRIGR
jgi:hypothetical protein